METTYDKYLKSVGGANNSDYFDMNDFNTNAGNNFYEAKNGLYTNSLGNNLGSGLAGSNLTAKYFTPLAQKQNFVSTVTNGTGQLGGSALLDAYNNGVTGEALQSMYDNMDSKGIFNNNGLASTSLGGMDLGTLGGLGMDIAKAWMGYDASKKAYNLQKKALNANIDDLEMKQDVAYNNYYDNTKVKESLAGAFGGDTAVYEGNINRLKKYASDGGEETQNA